MGRDFYEASPAARAVFDAAAAVMGDAFLTTIFEGDADAVTDTNIAQPGLLTVGAAIAAHLRSIGVTPSVCAGHSLGEFTALVAAEAMTFEEALPLVKERARLMSEDIPSGAMAAVIGMEPSDILAALPTDVDVANFNGPGQTIISGEEEAVARAIDALKAAGAKRVMPLKVSGAFHSRLMKPAALAFRDRVQDAAISAPKARFISSVSAREESDPERIRGLLGEQIAASVQWTGVMEAVGAVAAFEVGPGRVLQGLAKRTPGAPEITPMGTMDDAAQLGGKS